MFTVLLSSALSLINAFFEHATRRQDRQFRLVLLEHGLVIRGNTWNVVDILYRIQSISVDNNK